MFNIPRLKLAQLPTPVEPLDRLAAQLGGPRLLVKRDDLTGLALGGNKMRKLEFLMAQAAAQGADAVVTTGAVQSNHCRQTAAAAARLGLACTLILAGEPPAALSGNLLLDRLLGAELVWTEKARRDQVLQETFDQLRAQGKKPYLVTYGGSSPVGVCGYVFAVQELLEQGCTPDWIVFASSSGGTQAGLLLGARLFGYHGRILGISVDEPAETLRPRIAALAERTAELLGVQEDFTPDDVLVNADYCSGGYAVMGAAEVEAIQLLALAEGLLVDPVYTGRAAAGLLDLVRKGFFRPDETALFWHTGGTPALFVDRYQQGLSA